MVAELAIRMVMLVAVRRDARDIGQVGTLVELELHRARVFLAVAALER